MKNGRMTATAKRFTSWLIAFAMVFTTVVIPSEVVKADTDAHVEFYGAVLDESDATGRTLKFIVDEKTVKVQLGTKEGDVFTAVAFGDKNGNGRYEVNCVNVASYYLYIVNTESADYRLRVDEKDESVDPNGYFRFHAPEGHNVVSVQMESKNQQGGNGGGGGDNPGPGSEKLTVKLGDEVLCEENVISDVVKDGISFKEDNGRITMILSGADYSDKVLEIQGNPTIEAFGINRFNKVSLKKGSGFEMWGRMTFLEGANYENPANLEAYYGHITLANGFEGESEQNRANEIRFRDSLIVDVGTNTAGYESSNTIAFQNINDVKFWNYDFHDRDAQNSYIYTQTAFKNVDKVDVTSANIDICASKLCDNEQPDRNTEITIFAEGIFAFTCKDTGNLSLWNKYYESYPENAYVENATNAGEAGPDYVKTVNIDANISSENEAQKYKYTVEDYTAMEYAQTHKLTSSDPILYSVSYNPNELETLQNADKGAVEMSGYTKGYYTVDKKTGRFEAWIAAGETVNVKILPDAGYQYVKNTLTINADRIDTAAGDDQVVGSYSFVMPTNAGHMFAEFVKTDDIVEVAANNVVSAADIDAGNSIGFGNAFLSVDQAAPTQEEKDLIKAADNVSGATYQYIDLSLSQYVVKNYDKDAATQQAWKTQLTDLNSNVSISLSVKNASSSTQFDVVRLHNGKAEKLTSKYDSAKKTVTFETDGFSTYTLVKSTKNDGSGGNNNAPGGSSGGGATGGTSDGNKTTVSDNKAVSSNTTSGNSVSGNTPAVSGDNVLIDTKPADGKVTDTKTGAVFSVNDDNTLTYEGPASKDVKKVNIPKSVVVDGKKYKVTEISSNAFKGCNKLTTVAIPATIESIGKNAFAGCTKLEKIVVKKNVEVIDAKAFKGCKNLKTFTIKSKKVEKIGKNAFKGVPKDATVKVPKAKKAEYEKMLRKAGYKGKIK